MNRRVFLTAVGAVATGQKLRRLQLSRTALDFPLDPGTPTITTTRYPYLQNVRSDRASILWATLESGAGLVEYSTDGVNFSKVPARSRFFSRAETSLTSNFVQYQANITGLQPGTDYVYRVSVSGADVTPGGNMQFRTAGPGPFDFLAIGDSGYGQYAEQFTIAQRILTENPALVLHTGDLVYGAPSGSFEGYQRNYFNYYYATMSSVPFFPSLGNHDYETPNALPYLAVHSVPTENVPPAERGRYYSFDWGNVHFVSLDGNASLERAVNSGGSMLRWLEDDLRSTRQFWRIVYFHYPPYAAGPNMNDPHSALIRQYVVPILEAYGVQVVLTGHEHSYQRSQPLRKSAFVPADVGTNYISTGGGGALLYPVYDNYPIVAFGKSAFHYLRAEVRGTKITFHAIRHDGAEIDTYTVAPRPVFTDDAGVAPIVMTPGPTSGATVRILGRGLAADETFVCAPIAPTELGGTTVTVNGRPIQLLYVSGSQIYAQLPFNVDGNVTVRITTANGSSEMSY